MNIRSHYLLCSFGLLLFLLLVQLQERKVSETVLIEPLTCVDVKKYPGLVHPCIVEIIDDTALTDLPQLLRHLSPAPFQSLANQYTQDWIPLVLFPFVEESVREKCVDVPDHIYCNQQKRQQLHQLIDNRLHSMLQSDNEMLQYYGLLLSCARGKNGHKISWEQKNTDNRRKGYMTFLSSCQQDAQYSSGMVQHNEMYLLSLWKYTAMNPEIRAQLQKEEGNKLWMSLLYALDQSRQE